MLSFHGGSSGRYLQLHCATLIYDVFLLGGFGMSMI